MKSFALGLGHTRMYFHLPPRREPEPTTSACEQPHPVTGEPATPRKELESDSTAQEHQPMRWASWRGLLCFLVIVALIGLTAWAGHEAWVYDHWLVPVPPCAAGMLLLLIGPRRVVGEGEDTWKLGQGLLCYAVLLCVFNPVMAVSPYNRWTPPAFALALGPFVWTGVTGLGRGFWTRAVGAWLVLFGQYFALIYNAAHSASGIGFLKGWVF
jgi:hypothetical protein